MSRLKSMLDSLKGRKAPSASQIVNIVEKRSSTGLGGFVDINNDLGLLLQENKEPEVGIMMPYFYARRIATAGMFSQGAIGSQDFEQIENLFFNFMAQVGNEISQEAQVIFQEESLDSALELIGKYLVGINRQSAPLLIVAAKLGISVRDALLEAFDESENMLAETVKPVMYRDWVMKAEYCAGFFASGWWQQHDDFESTSEKVIDYLNSVGLPLKAN